MSEYVIDGIYYRMSRVGIPRCVKLRGISGCGRYATFTYGNHPKRHQCRITELQREHPAKKR